MSVDRHVIKRGIRYVAVIDAARDPATGKCKQIKRTFPTKREAEVWEREVRAGNDRGEYLQPAKVTIAGYLSRWLAAASHLRPPRERYAHVVERIVDPLDRRRGQRP
jgi:hypothetical protein